jgi:TonB family protein
MRLRQLRARSRAAILTPDLEALRSELAPRADVRVSCEIAQPAAFGLRRPVVLLPDRFFDMDPEAQRTVAYHELLHVARRDWPWIVLEEVARALFWFHPAVWCLVERIQESREQLVDRLVIARIPSKRAYMAALLAFADGDRRPPPLATAFLRRRHLRSRLRKLVKESVMSRRRLVWTAVVLVSVMAGAVAGTAMALPLGSPLGSPMGEASAQAPQVVDGKDPGVTLPKIVFEVKPQYTPEAMQARVEGTGILTAVIGTDGTPADIKVTKSVDAEHGLDKQAVDAISQWRFGPGLKDGKPVPVRIEIEVRFRMK